MWFTRETSKYSFLVWLAIHNCLTTVDRMQMWNQGQYIDCIFCENAEETRNYLFFECRISGTIWKTFNDETPWLGFHHWLGNDYLPSHLQPLQVLLIFITIRIPNNCVSPLTRKKPMMTWRNNSFNTALD